MNHPDETTNEVEVSDEREAGAPTEGQDAPVEDFAAAGPPAPEVTDNPRDVNELTEEAEELERHFQPGNL